MDATYSFTKYLTNTSFQELPERMIRKCPQTPVHSKQVPCVLLSTSAAQFVKANISKQGEYFVCIVHHPSSTGLTRSIPVPPTVPFQTHSGVQEPLRGLQAPVPHGLAGAEGEGQELTPHGSQRLLAGAQLLTCHSLTAPM